MDNIFLCGGLSFLITFFAIPVIIQVAKEKNVDELGMIHAMNMIAGDEFFNVAVEGLLPDITDREYMYVLESAYKTVKQDPN